MVAKYTPKESKNTFAENFDHPNGVYICNITLDNDTVVSEKLIH
jgi:hypothetical protein